MPTDMFLKLETVDGESPDSKHKNEIEVLSFSFGASQPATMSFGGGGGAGKVAMQDLHISKRVDKASSNLFLRCATGHHIPKGILTVRKAGKEQQEYLKVTMSDLLVSSINFSGADHSGSAVVMEQVTLNFSKIEWEYKEQKADGSLGGSIKSGYDLKLMKEV